MPFNNKSAVTAANIRWSEKSSKEVIDLKKEIAELKNILKTHGEVVTQQNTPEINSKMLQAQVDMDQQATVDPNGRRYSENVKLYALYDALSGAHSYNVRSQNMNMVSRQTNWRTKQKLRELLKMDEQSRVDTEFSNVPVTLRQHRLANNIPDTETVPVSVQVDAVALQDNPTYGKNGEAKNVTEHVDDQGNTIIKPICYGFAFLMVPLDNKYKPELLFMLLDKGLNETRVPEIYEKLAKQLQLQRYHSNYMITDGDNMYTKLYSQSLTMSIIDTHKKHIKIGEYKRIVVVRNHYRKLQLFSTCIHPTSRNEIDLTNIFYIFSIKMKLHKSNFIPRQLELFFLKRFKFRYNDFMHKLNIIEIQQIF
ncbi:Hypothetical_protein [Hexamita inflata]|uniref:Hypothetical_protein n=1 Tax=Hexamita inflata TaxID=28002 RepID=A0AA86U7D4_9EUKA|nr:Hypothetical protein HINF_LOCUS33420 [Hexamita inflata]